MNYENDLFRSVIFHVDPNVNNAIFLASQGISVNYEDDLISQEVSFIAVDSTTGMQMLLTKEVFYNAPNGVRHSGVIGIFC